jgi:hypothetical protein
MRNPKFEIQNSKQIQNDQKSKNLNNEWSRVTGSGFWILIFGFAVCLGFRVSDFHLSRLTDEIIGMRAPPLRGKETQTTKGVSH